MEDRLFDFEELWYLFKRRFWIIIVIPVLMTSLALYKVSKLKPSYSASAKVFMGNSNDMLDIYSQDELSYYSQFITIFSEISKIDGFLDDTLKKHKIDKTSLEVASALSFEKSVLSEIWNLLYSSSNNISIVSSCAVLKSLYTEKKSRKKAICCESKVFFLKLAGIM